MDAGQHTAVLRRSEDWLPALLPCDVHQPLIAAGLMAEPLEGSNQRTALWTEKKSWWFLKEFEVTAELLAADRVELTLESLDVEADIFLNGAQLGHQRSAFYPFLREVKSHLRLSGNQLLVRVTTGLEHVRDADLAAFPSPSVSWPELGRADHRRILLRKPQFTFGWDWAPRVPSCGIMGSARLTGHTTLAIRATHVTTSAIAPVAKVRIEVEVENLHRFATRDATVKVEIALGDTLVLLLEREAPFASGINFVSLEGEIDAPHLWWPNGMGAQPLYTVRTTVRHANGVVAAEPQRLGLRTVRLKQEPLGEDERSFVFEVNGVDMFAKGANWVPADSIYARVTPEKHATLVRRAREANFNMLRVWGGGLYEPRAFYDACDEQGILVWHDFMFSCALYPDALPWFREEVEREMDYQTRRLRQHPCLVLWCGNNENHWGAMEWWNAERKNEPAYFGGEQCYNQIAPRVVRRNCPEIPYWNGSPYGGQHPNGDRQGDCHHWQACTMNPEVENRISPWEYDKVTAKFVSEYGYVGGCPATSVRRAMGTELLDRESAEWKQRINAFEIGRDTIPAGIRRHYADPEPLSGEDYLRASSQVQALMYGYSLEALRANLQCHGALFWMFNDCWVELGWSIVDYYLEPKISYHAVRRAFAPVRIVLRAEGDLVRVIGCNDTDQVMVVPAECGYVSFDGRSRQLNPTSLSLPPRSRTRIHEFCKAGHDTRRGLCCLIPTGGDPGILPASLQLHPFRELQRTPPLIHCNCGPLSDGTLACEVSCETHAHLVHLVFPAGCELSDDYFDLLPGERRVLRISNVPAGWKASTLLAEAL